MILILQNASTPESALQIQEHLESLGLSSQVVNTAAQRMIVVLDDVSHLPNHIFSKIAGVDKVVRTSARCPLASGQNAGIRLSNGTTFGGRPVVMAGPCSVEARDSLIDLARKVKAAGAVVLRGGAYKPRTNPYDFCGLGLEGLKYLAEASHVTGLPVISEVMSAEQVELADDFIDIFQIGARNMYNYELLKEVGRSRRPVLLKRAFSATIQELLQAAEYILLEGNDQVILCERGIRTFETHTRNTLDLSAVAALKTMTELPVIVDPSHGTGRKELIRPMSRAAIACGADGLLIEVHETPAAAYSDGAQAITPAALAEIVQDIEALHLALTENRVVSGNVTGVGQLQPV